MISKLLNILRRIDATRLTLIDVLKSKNYPVNTDSTYNSLVPIISNNLKDNELNKNFEQSPYEDVVYYDNPEDDPMVWKVPTEWPDVETVLRNAEYIPGSSASNNEFPVAILLFKVDDATVDTVNFQITSGPSSSYYYTTNTKTVPDNTIYLKNIISSIAFSDSSEPMVPSTTFEHTWDAAKDIVVNGTRYRYILLYCKKTQSYNNTDLKVGVGNNCGMSLISMTLFGQLITNSYEGYFTWGINASKSLQFIKVIDVRYANFDTSLLPSDTLNKLISYGCKNLIGLKRIEFDLSDEYNPAKATGNMNFLVSSHINLNTFICNNAQVLDSQRTAGFAINNGLVYYKAPIFNIYHQRNYATATGTSSSNYGSSVINLKYIEIDPEVQKNYPLTVPCAELGVNSADSSQYGAMPNLSDKAIDVLLSADTLTGSIWFLSGCRQTIKLKSGDISTIWRLNVDTVEIENLTSTNTANFSDVRCRRLILDNLGTLTINNGACLTTVREFIAPALTEMNYTYTGGTYSFISEQTRTVYLPSLTSIPKPNIFYYVTGSDRRGALLTTLTLGDGFKSAIDFTENPVLSKESVLDLFNKLAPLTEDEIASNSYYVKLPADGLSMLSEFTEEEKAIATNKGWVLK